MIHLPKVFHLRNLPTADLNTHTPWPVFPRHRGWLSVFRNAPSRLVQIFGGSR